MKHQVLVIKVKVIASIYILHTSYVDFCHCYLDCNKQCPPGAHLKDCGACVCTSITLYGRVTNDVMEVVQNASIFLESMRYAPIATTGSLGRFSVNGVCIVSETIFIQAEGHAGQHVTPTEVNTTHWTISNVTLQKYSKDKYFSVIIFRSSRSSCYILNTCKTLYFVFYNSTTSDNTTTTRQGAIYWPKCYPLL